MLLGCVDVEIISANVLTRYLFKSSGKVQRVSGIPVAWKNRCASSNVACAFNWNNPVPEIKASVARYTLLAHESAVLASGLVYSASIVGFSSIHIQEWNRLK